MINKKQMANGVADFLGDSLIPSMSDRQMRTVLSLARTAVKKDCNLLDSFLCNPLISAVMPDEEGLYDVKGFIDVLKRSFDDDGYIAIVVPKIPFFMQDDKILRLTLDDIDDLMKAVFPEENEED